VGLPLGAELVKRGHEVFGLRLTSSADAEMKAAGIIPLTADITRLPDLQKLPGAFEWVINTVSSTRGGTEEYRQVYLQGTRNLIAWLTPAPPRKFLYTSSTSVYGQTDGSLVDESSPAIPASATSQVLLETEQVLLRAAETGFASIILRVAGIYGLGRGYWFQKFVRGEATIAGEGERILNMIHREDLVGVIVAALQDGRPGEIYNAVDDEPVAQIDFFRWLSEALGKPMPPFSAQAEEMSRKRGLTNKRISNRKLKREIGYNFRYPTFREGLRAQIELSR